jgi:phosphate transport system substrate-binding protein
MSQGVCTNLPRACSQAAARALLPCPDQDARCPTCGAALLPVGDGVASGTGGAVMRRTVVSLAMVAGVLGVGWQWWAGDDLQATAAAPALPATAAAASSPAVLAVAQAATALESEPPGVGTAHVFALRGMDVFGPVFGSDLLEAFLGQEGHVEIHRSPPDPLGAVLVSARRPGGLRQDIRLAFDGGAASPGDASLRRVSSTAGAELKDNQVLIGFDALAVVAHPASPIEQIRLSQLRQALTGSGLDAARLGGAAGPLRLHVRQPNTDAWTVLAQTLLGDTPHGTALQQHDTDTALVQAVVADERALGVVPLSAVGGAKVLAVVDSLGSVWKPTPATVATERYPLSHRLVMQLPTAAPSPLALRYAQFLASSSVQSRLRAAGFAAAAPALVDAAEIAPLAVGTSVKMPKDYLALVRGAQRMGGRIGFSAESTELDAVARVDVDRLARQLKEATAARPLSVMVLGVANDPGGFCANRTLSDQRAASVADALMAQGVAVQVVRGVGRFAPMPAAGADDAARERRVEVWVSDAPVRQPAPFKCVSGTGQVAMVGTAASAPGFLQSGP